jgi:NADH-quinone oxidoreductase subunit K
MIVPLSHLLIVAGLMFFMGMACTLARRNLIMILIGVEVMINAVGLTLVGASAYWRQLDGQLAVLLLMALTSAEVSISLAMVVYLQRRKGTIEADRYDEMKG